MHYDSSALILLIDLIDYTNNIVGGGTIMAFVSSSIPDWSRERKKGWMPAKALLKSIRDYQALKLRKSFSATMLSKVAVVRHRFWSVVTGADIPLTSLLGGGLVMPHPNGIVIHPLVLIGPNCMLFQQVTLGGTARGYPSIGGHVDIGAGAKVIGPVTVGNNAVIGANAVVLVDVPDWAAAVGNPARIIMASAEPQGTELALSAL